VQKYIWDEYHWGRLGMGMMVCWDSRGWGWISAGTVGNGNKFCGDGWGWGQISIPDQLSSKWL